MAYPVFIRAYSRDLGRTNGGMYDDDDIVDAGKSNTSVEDVERLPAEISLSLYLLTWPP